MTRTVKTRLVDPVADFLQDEIAGGVVLFAAASVALLWANSRWSGAYVDLWHTQVELGPAGLSIELDLRHWVNELLMALFFFVVGMEIKRELVSGALRDRRTAALPAIAAAAGVVLPAIVFTLMVGGGEAARGWAIPVATDIAFAVGVVALLGRRIPSGVRVFLLTIAIVDDIIAVGIIAVFYGDELDPAWLAVAAAGLAAVAGLSRAGVARILVYVPFAAVTWLGVYESGVHATIAGVALGLLVPARPGRGLAVHRRLEHLFHPVSAFVVVPLFALANAGVDLGGGKLGDALSSDVTWAVAVALVVGKLVGICGASLLALRLRVGALPVGMSRSHLLGVGALGGIGFTVSLFVADLAFADAALEDAAKVGVFLGSIFAGALGAALLVRTARGPADRASAQ